jgi:hypothetical protein
LKLLKLKVKLLIQCISPLPILVVLLPPRLHSVSLPLSLLLRCHAVPQRSGTAFHLLVSVGDFAVSSLSIPQQLYFPNHFVIPNFQRVGQRL